MQQRVQFLLELPDLCRVADGGCRHADPQRIIDQVIQCLAYSFHCTAGDCAAAQLIEHGLRGERGRGCAVLLSPLPHGLELFSGYDRGIEIRSNIAAVLQNTGHHIFVPGLAGVVGERFLIQLVCQALE